jgi:tryptophanyl-tRNA synthetase
LEAGRALIEESQHLSVADRERLFGYLEGHSKMILPEPQPLLTETPKMPGLDGQKMSKSYNNTIFLREDPVVLGQKIKKMPTDPARVRKIDVGDPARCPVFALHQVYTDSSTREWAAQGCRSASIGCLECKQPLIDAIVAEQAPMHERAQIYLDDPVLVRNIVADGCERARKMAQETMRDVREAMGLNYT